MNIFIKRPQIFNDIKKTTIDFTVYDIIIQVLTIEFNRFQSIGNSEFNQEFESLNSQVFQISNSFEFSIKNINPKNSTNMKNDSDRKYEG